MTDRPPRPERERLAPGHAPHTFFSHGRITITVPASPEATVIEVDVIATTPPGWAGCPQSRDPAWRLIRGDEDHVLAFQMAT